jgi:hypothetical protein
MNEITKLDIQKAFRSKAKLYHPDLNPLDLPVSECEYLLTELVNAYEKLMIGDKGDDDFISKYQIGHSNKVTLACELYTIQELQIDRFHDVYPIRIEYLLDDDDDDENERNNEEYPTVNIVTSDTSTTSSLSTYNVYPIHTHPDDSVLDLKRIIQESQYGIDWGLISSTTTAVNDSDNSESSTVRKRKKDRDGITIGWELIAVRNHDNNINNNNNNSQKKKNNSNINSNTNDNDDDDGNNKSKEKTNSENEEEVIISVGDFSTVGRLVNEVLSYHLFLSNDYQIQNGDTIYAVIRK